MYKTYYLTESLYEDNVILLDFITDLAKNIT